MGHFIKFIRNKTIVNKRDKKTVRRKQMQGRVLVIQLVINICIAEKSGIQMRIKKNGMTWLMDGSFFAIVRAGIFFAFSEPVCIYFLLVTWNYKRRQRTE